MTVGTRERDPSSLRISEGGVRSFVPPAVAVFCITLSMALRALVLLRYKVDSDESQHLHVAWSWSRGLEQYRDVFDNHMPLFHLLFAPLVAAAGERADIIFWMRLSMLPLLVAALACTYCIGRRLFSPTVGLWAAILVSISTGYLLSSTEFRTDNLWAMFWMVALAVIVSGSMTYRRTLLVGVLLGLCFTVSLKSVVLVGALGIGTLATLRWGISLKSFLARCALLLTGAVTPVAALSAYFFSTGAGDAYVYCTIRHNLLPQLGHASHPERGLIAILAIPLVIASSRFTGSNETHPEQRRLRSLIFITALSYLALLVSFWPLIPRQDYLPAYPLIHVFIAGAVFAIPKPFRVAALSGLVVASLVAFIRVGVLQHDQTFPETSLLRDVLKLAGPSEPVMDTKGETIFRNRPYYYVLETITNQRIVRGLMPDEIRQRIIRTKTCVVTEDSWRYPAASRRFLNDHYVSVGLLRVPGRIFENSSRALFEVPFDASYAMVGSRQHAVGFLDGSLYVGPRHLSAGVHEFVCASRQTVAFVWSTAIDRGFSPFAELAKEAQKSAGGSKTIPYAGLATASIPHL
ncbi:MAG TPA: glycosyltransferase family 39 protein [Thermoanaerobaculia bacterium]|nr:glycosyltransferase family 39 protein [Thermoanaerobaculia bacterium]